MPSTISIRTRLDDHIAMVNSSVTQLLEKLFCEATSTIVEDCISLLLMYLRNPMSFPTFWTRTVGSSRSSNIATSRPQAFNSRASLDASCSSGSALKLMNAE